MARFILLKGITILGYWVALLKCFIWFSIHHWYKEYFLWSLVDHRLNPLVVDYSFRFNPFDLTHRSNPSNQNKVLAKVIWKLITLNLMLYFNSIKYKRSFNHLSKVYQKARKLFRFSMHECNAHLYILSSNCWDITVSTP